MDCYLNDLMLHHDELLKAAEKAIVPCAPPCLHAPAPQERSTRSPVNTPVKTPTRKRKPASAGGSAGSSPLSGGSGGSGGGGGDGGKQSRQPSSAQPSSVYHSIVSVGTSPSGPSSPQ